MVVATGFFDQPNLLNVPGEALAKVTHYYREPYQYVRQKVVDRRREKLRGESRARLLPARRGGQPHRPFRDAVGQDQVLDRPDLERRIAEGSIRGFFNTTLEEIRESSVTLRTPDGVREIPNDWVVAMTGYHPDYRFLEVPAARVLSGRLSRAGRRRGHVSEQPAGYLPGRYSLWRLLHEPVVHRKRTLSRQPDRETHCRRARRPNPVRNHSLEDRGVGMNRFLATATVCLLPLAAAGQSGAPQFQDMFNGKDLTRLGEHQHRGRHLEVPRRRAGLLGPAASASCAARSSTRTSSCTSSGCTWRPAAIPACSCGATPGPRSAEPAAQRRRGADARARVAESQQAQRRHAAGRLRARRVCSASAA